MNCSQCHKEISLEGNLAPLFCPHCNHPWTKNESQNTTTVQVPPVDDTVDAKEPIPTPEDGHADDDKRYQLIRGVFHCDAVTEIPLHKKLAIEHFEKAYENIPLPVLDQIRYYLQEHLPHFQFLHNLSSLILKTVVGQHPNPIPTAYFATLCYPNVDFFAPEQTFQCLTQNTNQPLVASPLAICFQKGIGTEKDPKKALDILKQAVKAQDPLAQYTMALWYQEGTLLPFDFPKAFHYASLSAKQDFPLGQILLGHMTFCGEATRENHSLGLKYLSYSSSLQGDLVQYLSPLSQIVAPVMYPTGITIQSLQSLREEFPHISYFPYFQGKLYEKEKNIPKAKECYQEAAKHHLTLALYQLAKLEESTQNTENLEIPPIQIPESALYYHQEAANRYYAPSQTELGKYYLAPNPETQNIPLAIQLFQKAALQQDGEASYQQGLLSLHGISALSNDPDKAYTLAKNLPEALAHFKESWAQDYFPAKTHVFALQDILGEDDK